MCEISHSTGIDSMEIHAMHLEIANRRKPLVSTRLELPKNSQKVLLGDSLLPKAKTDPTTEKPVIPVIPVIPVMLALQTFNQHTPHNNREHLLVCQQKKKSPHDNMMLQAVSRSKIGNPKPSH